MNARPSSIHRIPILIALALMVGCEKPVEVVTKPRPVYTVTVEAPLTTIERSFSGQLVASDGVDISFEVSGRVIEVMAKQGQRYETGAVLARLDSRDYQSRLQEAQAGLTLAAQDLSRLKRLFESGNSSQSQLDSAMSKERSAQANFDLAKKQLDNTTLTMPYAGVIASVDIETQQVVSQGQSVIAIQGTGPMEFEFGVPGEVVPVLEPGRPMTVTTGNGVKQNHPAKLLEISPRIEENTTYLVTALLDKVEPSLREGMDGEAVLNLPNPTGEYITLPLTCVVGGVGNESYVWVVNPSEGASTMTVSRRPVTLGKLLKEGQVAILEGLQPGEIVVSRGVHQVEAGMEVSLYVKK